MNSIIIPAVAVGAMGLVFGAVLAFASIVFKVDSDERIDKVCEILPGANCGGCGYAGCSAFAKEIVENGADSTRCNLMTVEKAKAISEIMGTEMGEIIRKYAVVACRGTCDAAKNKYIYEGTISCEAASRLAGGPKACEYGCMGLGSCVNVCSFDAISVVDGVACVDKEKCTGCGTCTRACPKGLISLVPYNTKSAFVQCNSKDKGVVVKDVCTNGCIGCRLCTKKCEAGAIEVNDNLAKVDVSKCTSCGACIEACPKKIIYDI